MSLPKTCPTCHRAERNSPASIRRSLERDVETWQAEAARLGDAAAALAAENKGLRARVSELEAEAKQAREYEAWAEDNGVVIDAEPVEKGWCAMLVREDGPLIEVPSAKGPTIHAAIRALREKVEGGAR